MAGMSDEMAERIIERIRKLPPDLPYGGRFWVTPASQRPYMETVLPSGPKIEVRETEETKREKERILQLLHRRPF